MKLQRRHRLRFKRCEIHLVDCTSQLEITKTINPAWLEVMPGFVFSKIEGYDFVKVTMPDYCCSAKVIMPSPWEKMIVLDFWGFK